jgi:hypothetical protein
MPGLRDGDLSDTSGEEMLGEDEIASGEEWTDDERMNSLENMKLDGDNPYEADNAYSTEIITTGVPPRIGPRVMPLLPARTSINTLCG